jgi:hypothetical protein
MQSLVAVLGLYSARIASGVARHRQVGDRPWMCVVQRRVARIPGSNNLLELPGYLVALSVDACHERSWRVSSDLTGLGRFLNTKAQVESTEEAHLSILMLAFLLLFQFLLLLLTQFTLLFQLLFLLLLILLALFSFLFLLLTRFLPLLLLRFSFQGLLLIQVFLRLLALYSFLFLFIVLCFLFFAHHIFLFGNWSGPNSGASLVLKSH